jgi:predicted metal-dependent hydrolase
MIKAAHFTAIGEIPVNWCNADAASSSVMEAASFVTPVLENFFIRTVVEAVHAQENTELVLRCRSFICEESNHSRAHNKFNFLLLLRLEKKPPALAIVELLLDCVTRRLSLPNRLAVAATLEHLAAVMSKLYLNQQPKLTFTPDFAR